MKVILSHSGKQHSYQVAKALNNLRYLEKFYTSSYIKNKHIQDYLIKKNNTYWTRRFLEGLDGDIINSNWQYEVNEILLRKFMGKNKYSHRAVLQRDIAFDKDIARKLEIHKADIFWGFQGSCLESLKSANTMGLRTICEQTAPYYQAVKDIIQEERHISPEWQDSMEDINFPLEYERRLIEEPETAKKIIVASEFSRMTFNNSGIENEKIIKLHLGCDISKIPFKDTSVDYGDRPLKLLYVGRISQSKGIKYLLEAMLRFQKSEVTLDIIGHLIGSGNALKDYKNTYRRLSPLSQEELFRAYGDYDALVLPTLYDGFGLVLIEAMAAGLPVIATKNSFGPELITEGKNGFIVPISDAKAIEKSISKLMNSSKEEYRIMRMNARETAEKFTWKAYQDQLSNLLK